MSVTLDRVSQRTVLGNPNFSLLAKDRIVFSDDDGSWKDKLSALEEGHWYKVSYVKRFELNSNNEPIDRLVVGSSFIGRLDKKDEITAGGSVYLDFTSVCNSTCGSGDTRVRIDFNARKNDGEVNFTEFCEVALNGDKPSDNTDNEVLEITTSNFENSDVQTKVSSMRGRRCALWWGKRDLGDFTFNGYNPDEKSFQFSFGDGTILFAPNGELIHVLVKARYDDRKDRRERSDNLYIKCLEY